MNSIPSLLLAALLALFPRAGANIARIAAHQESIIADAASASDANEVPPSVLLVVGFLETHLGTDANEGGGWGAPVDARHRHTAGTAHHAARVLRRGFVYCGSWRGAIGFFRSGLCAAPHNQSYVRTAVRLITQIHTRTNMPMPDEFDRHTTAH